MEIGKADFSAFNYESPIELIEGRMRTEVEDKVIRVVQEMGIKADKDELLWALAYDRRQYEKGYSAGYVQRELEIVKCRDCRYSRTYTSNFENIYLTCDCMSGLYRDVEGDDYCSCGERNEVNE